MRPTRSGRPQPPGQAKPVEERQRVGLEDVRGQRVARELRLLYDPHPQPPAREQRCERRPRAACADDHDVKAFGHSTPSYTTEYTHR
jgi:hypothetical protein